MSNYNKKEELEQFYADNEEELSGICSSLARCRFYPEEVSYIAGWRNDLQMEWPVIKRAFVIARQKMHGVSTGSTFLPYVASLISLWSKSDVRTEADLEKFEESVSEERERLLKKVAAKGNTPAKTAGSTSTPPDPIYSRYGLVDLKPCPFCGCADITIRNQFSSKRNAYYTLAECSRCGASTRTSTNFSGFTPDMEEFWHSDSVLEVAKLWNDRV